MASRSRNMWLCSLKSCVRLHRITPLIITSIHNGDVSPKKDGICFIFTTFLHEEYFFDIKLSLYYQLKHACHCCHLLILL